MKSKEHPEFDRRLKGFFAAMLVMVITWFPAMLIYKDFEWVRYYLITTPTGFAAALAGWQAAKLDDTKSEEK